MKVIIYARVSTDKQEASEEMQVSKCRSYCEMKGYEVVDVLVDSNVSGGTNLFDRPQGSKIEELINNGSIDHIVALKLDRIFRDVVDGLTTIKEFNDKCVTFSIIDQGGSIIDTSTAIGEMVITMFLAMGRFEKEQTRERVKKALNHRKENLKVYSGSIPYGFTRKGDDLVVNPEEMEIVKQMYRMKPDSSYRQIARVTQLGLSKVHRILNDEFYEKYI